MSGIIGANIISTQTLEHQVESEPTMAQGPEKLNGVLEVGQGGSTEIERNIISPFWEVGVVLLAFFLFAILQRSFPKKVFQYINALISNRFISQLTREEQSSESIGIIILELVYFIVIALFANELYYSINPAFLLYGFEGFALFALVFLVLYLAKVVANNLIGWLLDLQFAINDFQFFNFLSHGAVAVGLFPIVILILFSHLDQEVLLTAGALIISLLYVHRIYRLTLRFWREKRFLLKYFILYICGLEILPVLVLAKFASKTL